ncbi:hypothetical protein [Streptomyces roseoviridis]|uniref:Uncharacterized protein n=1 Tax=Streptomyces roseoviridis TaxID=67361 RepID=A0ABV5QPM2_9ACTN
MTTSQEPDKLPDVCAGTPPAPCGCRPSAALLGRARRGWEAFLARTGPLPGEAGSGEARRRSDGDRGGR